MKLLLKLYCVIAASLFAARAGAYAQTLADAADNTNLVWITSPSNSLSRPWFVEMNANPLDGVDGAVSGTKNLHGSAESNSVSWLETTVVGPGSISYWCRVSSEETQIFPDEIIYYDFLVFEIGGVEVDRIVGPCLPWQYRSFAVPEGTNTLRWTYLKDSTTTDSCGIDQARLDQVKFETSPPISLSEALGNCGVNWLSGGNTNPTYWIGETNVSVDGKGAESGSLNYSEESYLRAVVSGVSNVSFLWRVSSRTNFDGLEFYTNGYVHNPFSPPANYAGRISGEVTTWRSNFFKLSPTATNTLTWRYVKSGMQGAGANRGWVDQIAFKPQPAPTPYTLASPTLLLDGSFQFSLVGQSNCTCRVEVSTNLFDWTTLTDVFTTNTTTTVHDPGAANAEARFYRGNSQ